MKDNGSTATVLRLTTTVQPGGRIEFTAPELADGEAVEVIVRRPGTLPVRRRHALEILAEAPGHRLFKTADEVDAYVRSERDSWGR